MNKTIFIFRFIHKTPGSYWTNIKRVPRVLELHQHYTSHRQRQFKQQHAQYIQTLEKPKIIPQVKRVVHEMHQKIEEKASNLFERHKRTYNEGTYEKQVQGIIKKFFQYLKLYYQSLQNLVEGRRQVLHNEQFKFEDGKTVKEKAEILEKRIANFAGRQVNTVKAKFNKK